ncbi:iron-hydroxamate ABC transporter substrate-binding protein [Salinibacillus aidingensis]|uniref:Iron-hydroxamate ABC transporter substrate-binding protein n=1 Tax=Salinibacillus aidingensis TaxID=237684 RepID=A0ABP3KYU2_9BACI
MYKFNKIRLMMGTILLTSILIVAGCSESNTEEKKDESEQNNEVTVDSQMGEVTLPSDAEQIIAPFHEDTLLALGVTPVAKWAIGNQLQNYLEQDLKDIPKIEWNMPVEQVLKHQPDLIILEHGIDSYEGSYEDYKKIAPTFVMKEETTNSWRKQLEVFGEILNKDDKATKVLNQYNDKVKEAKEQLSQTVGNETVAVIWATGNQFFLFEENRHSAEVLYSELGVTPPELVKNLGDAQTKWNPISLEKLSELKADHVFILAEEGEQGITTLENSSVWQSTPAAENGNVYILNDQSNWTNRGLIASQETIKDVLEYLGE